MLTNILSGILSPILRANLLANGAVLPVNNTPPSIAGTTYQGQTLTATPGVWSSGTPTGQWQADGVDIVGATALTYVVLATNEGKSFTYIETNSTETATSNTLHHWVPTDLGADLMLWVDPADTSTITEVATEVSQLNDKSGLARNLTQTLSAKPLTGGTVGTLAALTYTADYLQRTNTVISQNQNRLYVAATAKTDATASIRSLFHISNNVGTGTSRFILRLSAAGLLTIGGRRLDADTLTTRAGATNVNSTTFLTVAGLEWASANSFARLNGSSQIADGAFQTAGPSENLPALALTIGGRLSADTWTTDIGDVFVFTASADVADSVLEKAEGYMAHKRGLTANLPGGHPYKTAVPTP